MESIFDNIFNTYSCGNKEDAKKTIEILDSKDLVPFLKSNSVMINDCNKNYYKDTFETASSLYELVLTEIETRLAR